MQKKHSSRPWWSVEYAVIVLMCTVLLGLMGCKESDPLSSEKKITEFSITLKEGETAYKGTIDPVTRKIEVTLPVETPVTWLVPTITASDLAEVSPASGMEVDFSAPKTYTVTAEDGSTLDYLVTVIVPLGTSTKSIVSFSLKAKNGTAVGTGSPGTGETIVIETPWGTDVKWLVPSIDIDGVSVSPKSDVAQDFSEPVRYTVTAQDGSTKEYLVTVTVGSGASAKTITSFGLKTKDGTDVGAGTRTAIGENVITVLVPNGTDVQWLVPVIDIPSTASVSPATAVAQDFSEPVQYTVTAQDGSTKEYLVTVTEATLKSLTIAEPTKASYKVGEALDLAGFSVTATYSDDVTETFEDYNLSEFENDTIGTKTITVTVERDGVTLQEDFTVTVTGETVPLRIELVNDKIVNLFGLTQDEVNNGILLSTTGLRREVVISLTGYTNDGYLDVSWKIDGGKLNAWDDWAGTAAENVVTIKADNYTFGRHWVEFTGTKLDGPDNKIPYSKTFYFTVTY